MVYFFRMKAKCHQSKVNESPVTVTDRLFLQERLDQITTLLEQQGRVSVSDLSARFGVSAVTIRNDLASLEQRGRLLGG